MSDLSYLDQGLFAGEAMRADLAPAVRRLAQAWLAAGIDPTPLELCSEHLARWSAELGEATVGAEALLEGLAYLELPDAVAELLRKLVDAPCDARHLAGVAVHLLDLAEAMALQLFVPELPALFAHADRTGDAARNVGVARHLKG